MLHIEDTFKRGDQTFDETLRKYWAEPVGYVPQHDQAHVVIRPQKFKTGLDVRKEREAARR